MERCTCCPQQSINLPPRMSRQHLPNTFLLCTMQSTRWASGWRWHWMCSRIMQTWCAMVKPGTSECNCVALFCVVGEAFCCSEHTATRLNTLHLRAVFGIGASESRCRSGRTGWSRISAIRWQTHCCARRWRQSGGMGRHHLINVAGSSSTEDVPGTDQGSVRYIVSGLYCNPLVIFE